MDVGVAFDGISRVHSGRWRGVSLTNLGVDIHVHTQHWSSMLDTLQMAPKARLQANKFLDMVKEK